MQTRSEKNTKSCGCFARETARALLSRNKYRQTHGLSKTGTYKSWVGMLSRCTYPSHIEYPRYGGRGITVCDRWSNFENFLEEGELLLKEDGARCVKDEQDLRSLVERLLLSPEERQGLGGRALFVSTRLRGATQRHLAWIERQLRLYLGDSAC